MSALPLPLAAFFAGLISFLSPCVLPLVPGYVSLVSGAGVEQLRHRDAAIRRSVLVNSLMFILGFSVVFITLGAIASSIGHLLGRHLSLLTKVAGVIIVLFGLHLTGWMPVAWLHADKRLHGLGEGGTATGAFLVGFSFAFGWTPCAGPVFAAILTLAASEATVNQGAVLLAVYSLGLAMPFLLTSVAIGRFLTFYATFRHHLHTLEVVSGILLIAVGMLVFTRHFVLINAWMNGIPFFRMMAERFL